MPTNGKSSRLMMLIFEVIAATAVVQIEPIRSAFLRGCSSDIDATGRVLYTADAYRNDGKRFTVIADDRLTAFLELERVTRESLRFPNAV
jgi:hypothetical protein